MALVFEGIQKVYPNGFRAVNHLDLEVKDGEFFTLLGPSGCGKTTTLRMIAGLETPSAGKVFIGGRDFTRTHPRPQWPWCSRSAYPALTVRDNLILNLKVQVAADDRAAAAEVSRMLGIERRPTASRPSFRGPGRQRIALGRALIRRPNIFLMDGRSAISTSSCANARTELKALHEPARDHGLCHARRSRRWSCPPHRHANGGELLQVGTPQDLRSAFQRFRREIRRHAVDQSHPRDGAAGRFCPGARAARRRLISLALRSLRRRRMTHLASLAAGLLGVARSRDTVRGPWPARFRRRRLIEPMGSVNHAVLRFDGPVTADDGLSSSPALERAAGARARVWAGLLPDVILFDGEWLGLPPSRWRGAPPISIR